MLPLVRQVIAGDHKYLVFESEDLITQELIKNGEYEPVTSHLSTILLQEITKPCVLDVGANLGAFTIPIGKSIAKANGIVYAFEPLRIVYYQLCGNIFLNQLDNVYAFNCAVSNLSRSIEIPEFNYDMTPNIGSFSLHSEFRDRYGFSALYTGHSSSVASIRLDDIDLKQLPHLIKIDVEGHELEVLQGAEKLIRKSNYPPILFECWKWDWYSEKRSNLMREIERLGYEIYEYWDWMYVAQHPSNNIRYKFNWHGTTLRYEKVV